MRYNRNITCRDTPCQLEHKCNTRIGEGKICPEKHKGRDHEEYLNNQVGVFGDPGPREGGDSSISKGNEEIMGGF